MEKRKARKPGMPAVTAFFWYCHLRCNVYIFGSSNVFNAAETSSTRVALISGRRCVSLHVCLHGMSADAGLGGRKYLCNLAAWHLPALPTPAATGRATPPRLPPSLCLLLPAGGLERLRQTFTALPAISYALPSSALPIPSAGGTRSASAGSAAWRRYALLPRRALHGKLSEGCGVRNVNIWASPPSICASEECVLCMVKGSLAGSHSGGCCDFLTPGMYICHIPWFSASTPWAH